MLPGEASPQVGGVCVCVSRSRVLWISGCLCRCWVDKQATNYSDLMAFITCE
jgi:hypothetical protein